MAPPAGCSSSTTARRPPAAPATRPATGRRPIPTEPRAASRGRPLKVLAATALCTAALSLHAAFAAHAALGTPIADRELSLAGAPGKAHVFGEAGATLLVFFRPGQPRSAEALRELAHCRKSLEGRPIRWLGVVADNAAPEAVAALVKDSGFDVPTLVDAGDALYGSLGLALHPVVVVADRERRLAAFEPFRTVDFCTVVAARVRHVLGEISEAEVQALLAPHADEAVDLKQGAKERMRSILEGRRK